MAAGKGASAFPIFRSIVPSSSSTATTVHVLRDTGSSAVSPLSKPCSCGGNFEASHRRTLDLADDVATFQFSNGVGLIDEIDARHRPEGEVAPPGRFCLTAVPLEQIGQQALRLLLLGSLPQVVGYASQ